jgi:hypothetical protein
MTFDGKELVICDDMDIKLDIRLKYNNKKSDTELDDATCYLMLSRHDTDYSSDVQQVFVSDDGQVTAIHKRFAPERIDFYKELLKKKARLVVVFE